MSVMNEEIILSAMKLILLFHFRHYLPYSYINYPFVLSELHLEGVTLHLHLLIDHRQSPYF